VVSVTNPYGRILGFLDRSRYFSIKYLIVVIDVRNFASLLQFAVIHAAVKFSSSADCSVPQALQFQDVNVLHILPGGSDLSHN
jgi:hypothetical protein